MGVCQRFCFELKRPMFELEEHPIGTLDIRASFHIGRGISSWVGMLKLVTLVAVVAALVNAFMVFPVPWWYPAYLTTWGVFFCTWYLAGSFFLTACSRSSDDDPENTNDFESASLLTKFTWLMFSVASVLECGIVVLYWVFDYDPEKNTINLNNLNVHGICMLIVILQGFLVDRVPMRIKHYVGTLAFGCLLCGWLAIQNVVLEYNPMQDDDDDALYDIMKWRENPSGAAILSVAVLLGGFPFFTCLLWLISLPGRRYLEILDDGAEGVVDYSKVAKRAERGEVIDC
mmetsp:Transcript_16012/g.39217  ORF Transcript_16012/g.39217 Transcript_16012/m.39217 type:complete len:287 (+) Transcript_16012:124-984(+)|eukprot:CAMPEP_0113646770 /NCGR_PEP_ID=MMETSP0017_2-20120614/24724_1 /TAXON_ID=2856 /ORGANISM="Cylindrotheca closterium" /LENGTH=286 /DNA_ID=CAMNT_0000558721 /DNA_START=65 /DNA_END=925 /DNA_ORIENTATION=+ /assembly_acc=CAM_ASM_000147